MAEIEIEGKTVEEAIEAGLNKLGCSREKVEVKILNEGTGGLFGLMGNKPARIQLTTKEDLVDIVRAQKEAKEILANLCKMMDISFKEINTAMVTGRILAEIKSADSRFLIGKNGNTLDALEHVLNLMLHKNPETRAKINLDVEGYRRNQESRIQSMAEKIAQQVKTTGKQYSFDPMPSHERRLIHLFLKGNPDVETLSEGEGKFRKIIVKPKN